MRVVRFLILGFAAVLALLAVLVAMGFTSAFQTWLARRELAAQPGLSATLGRVSAGLDHVRLEQFRFSQAGATLLLPSLDADLSLIAAAGRNVQVRKLVAKGWTVDLTSPVAGDPSGVNRPPRATPPDGSDAVPAPAQAAAAVFQGVFNQLRLPVDLTVDAVELEGEIIFPVTAGQPPGRARVTLTGGQLGAGHEGRFNFTATTALAPTAQVNALNATGSLLMAMDTPRTFSRLGVNVEAEARGPQFPQGTKLSATLTAGHSNAGESYTVVVEAAGRKLLTLQADYPAAGRAAGARPIKGAWMIDANDGDVAPFALGRPLPTFAAKGEGNFETDAAFAGYSATGRFTLTADKLGVVRPELQSLGAVQGALVFDLMHEGDTLRLTGLSLDLAGARPVIAARSLQPFVYNLKTRLTQAADPAKDLLSIELQGLPLAWLQAFVPGVALTGDDVRGAFVVGIRNVGIAALRSTAPLTLGNLGVAQSGRALVRGIDVSLKLSADYTAQGWQAELAEVTARRGALTLLTLAAKAGQLAGKDQSIKTTGQWTANLPALLAQPVAVGKFALVGGRASGEFSASLGATKEIQAKFTLAGLAVDPKVAAGTLPDITADVRADVAKDGRITLKAPVVLQREDRKSDLTLDGTLTNGSGGLVFAGHATSSFLAIDDAQMLAAVLAAPPPSAPASVAPTPALARDAQPFWAGVAGDLSVALKKVSYQRALDITDVAATIHMDAGVFKFDGVRAGLGAGSDCKVNGVVTFDAKAKEPYALTADLTVNNFDSVALFKALNPGKPATIEGRFNVTSKLTGGGANTGQLAARTRGDFQLSSKGGVCRLLEADLSDKIQKTQSTVATLGGLLAAATGRDKIADYANRTQIVVEVANDWKEIPFDQLNVVVSRDNDLNIILQDFTLISPTKRIAGTGEIRHVDGTPVLSQALDLRLQLWAQGKTADLMKRASLLNGQQDSLGYTAFLTPIRIIGTLENPDTSEFRSALLKAAGSSLLNNLLGR